MFLRYTAAPIQDAAVFYIFSSELPIRHIFYELIDNGLFMQTSTRKEKKMRKIYDIVAAISLFTIIGLAVLTTKGGRYAQYRIMR